MDQLTSRDFLEINFVGSIVYVYGKSINTLVCSYIGTFIENGLENYSNPSLLKGLFVCSSNNC